jgi:hypothetical protein
MLFNDKKNGTKVDGSGSENMSKFSNVAIPEPDKTIENVLCHCV